MNNYLYFIIIIVVDAIDKSYGMFPSTLGNVGVIEFEQIKNLIAKFIETLIMEIINSDYPISVSFDISKVKEIDDIFNPVVRFITIL